MTHGDEIDIPVRDPFAPPHQSALAVALHLQQAEQADPVLLHQALEYVTRPVTAQAMARRPAADAI
jgi:hypothetical protein